MHRSSQPSSRKTKVGVVSLVSVTDEGENVIARLMRMP